MAAARANAHPDPPVRPGATRTVAAALRASTRLPLLTVLTLCMLVGDQRADAAPIAPDWSTCKPGPLRVVGYSSNNFNLTDSEQQQPEYLNCCTLSELMQQQRPVRFKELREYLQERPLPEQPRVRPAAHLVAANRSYVQQLERAYRLMRELPATDPRSLGQLAHLHCMYGALSTNVMMQLGFPDLEYSVHRTWLWLPFHRWFTFFFERILGNLVGDPHFALPFWNWDDQSSELAPGAAHLANVIPHFYRDPQHYPALFDAYRHPKHAPGKPDCLVDLSLGYSTPLDRVDEIRRTNNRLLHTYVARTTGAYAPLRTRPGDDDDADDKEAEEPRLRFLSMAAHAGESINDALHARTGNDEDFEFLVHGAVHGWLSDPAQGSRDMGLLYTAVYDPLFMAHHANVDRMWAVWQSRGGRDFDHPDFLDAAFFFYNEDAELVRVTVRDGLDHRALKLDWQHVDNPWLRDESELASAAVE